MLCGMNLTTAGGCAKKVGTLPINISVQDKKNFITTVTTETSQSSKISKLLIESISNDSWFHIAIFLDDESLRSLLQVNSFLRNFLSEHLIETSRQRKSGAAEAIWYQACRSVWPFIPEHPSLLNDSSRNNINSTKVAPNDGCYQRQYQLSQLPVLSPRIVVDLPSLKVPTSTTVKNNRDLESNNSETTTAINFPILLSLAERNNIPTQLRIPYDFSGSGGGILRPTIDTNQGGVSEFDQQQIESAVVGGISNTGPSSFVRQFQVWAPVNGRPSTHDSAYYEDGTIIQFVDVVGQGNRSIMSDKPLPRPALISSRRLQQLLIPHQNDNCCRTKIDDDVALSDSRNAMQTGHQASCRVMQHSNNLVAGWTATTSGKEDQRRSLLVHVRRHWKASRSVTSSSQMDHFDNIGGPWSKQQEKVLSSDLVWKPFVVPFCCISPSMSKHTNDTNDSSDNVGMPQLQQVQSLASVFDMNVTPRLVSYYEVKILPLSKQANVAVATSDVNSQRQPRPWQREVDCVAVGLAFDSFDAKRRLPGWDHSSFGYHGDDGFVYHSPKIVDHGIEDNHFIHTRDSRQRRLLTVTRRILTSSLRLCRRNRTDPDSHNQRNMENIMNNHTITTTHLPAVPTAADVMIERRRRFGPTYGVNDTVGCGIDYHERAIFFTLNGTFLGYAFRDIPMEVLSTKDIFPTIGIDTNSPLKLNFGNNCNEPFLFNLSAYIRKQHCVLVENVVSKAVLRNTQMEV